MHFACSMNWSTDVAGAHVIDYIGAQRKAFFKAGREAVERWYEGMGWEGYFRFPPPENPLNTADFVLARYHHRRWVTHWFDIARRDGPCQALDPNTASSR